MNNKQIVYSILGLFVVIFLWLAGYMIYFTLFESQDIAMHPYNRRLDHLEDEVIRGDIYDSKGNLLARTEGEKRTYPYGARYAHAVGYSKMGKYGVESLANIELLYPDYNIQSLLKNAFFGERFQGRDIVLTLDDRLQKVSEESLESYKGAIVILEPSTGKIKAMYASPSFDPNDIVNKWDQLVVDENNSPLVNRATQGLYPPGSIFKIIPTIALIESREDYGEISYECKGSITKEDYTIKCFDGRAHGAVNLEEAFKKSCNSYFIFLQNYISEKQIEEVGQRLFFNKNLPIDMENSKSRLDLGKSNTMFDLSASYIGQGKTVVTPMHMAMLASLIANDGVLMEPYIFDSSQNKIGKVMTKNLPSYHEAILDEKLAKILQGYMEGVVKEGTASQLSTRGLVVGGKTGTAQNETGKDHSWFLGYAQNVEKPQQEIAFSIIVEGAGRGGKALEITQKILKAFVYLE